MSDWQAAQKQAYDDSLRARYGADPTVPYLSMPVSEFENLHEENRLLRAKIKALQDLARQWSDDYARARAETRRWKTVVAATHMEAGGHRNPYAECPSAICVAARMGK